MSDHGQGSEIAYLKKQITRLTEALPKGDCESSERVFLHEKIATLQAALREARAQALDKRRLKDQTCPQCNKAFQLTWGEDEPKASLHLRGCPSGGIYDVSICCPNCNYEEPL